MTLNLAFAGTGYIARIHAQAARKLPEVTLAAVVNHRPESRAAFAEEFAIPRQFGTVEELLDAGGVDAISINTPNYLHAPQSIAALSAGLPVMVEKPMAMNAAEARAMVAASRRSGAPLLVAHCWRFDEEAIWLRQQVASGRLGRLVRSKGYGVHVNWGPGGWFTQKKLAGGGALADMGIHAIDTVRFLMGDPRPLSVYARLGTHYHPVGPDYDVDDTGVIWVEWDNGVTSTFESGWWQPHADGPEASSQLYGTAGMASLFPTYLSLPDRQRQAVERIDPGFVFPRDPHCPQSMYDSQLAYFVDCINRGRQPVPGGAEGLVNVEIVDAATESSRLGRPVALTATEPAS